MNFKRWPYWVRGGIIMLVIPLFQVILVMQYLDREDLGKIIYSFIGYFAIGAFAGWLYGKIRRKKMETRKQSN